MSDLFKIVYEDNHVIVAVKRPNVLSQADRTGDPDMLTLLKKHIKEKYQKPGDVYLGLVHRLDRPVGGLMIFARTSKAAARLSQQLKSHDMGREYMLVCEGEINQPFTLTDYLLKDTDMNIVKVTLPDVPGAQQAVLEGMPVLVRDGRTLVKIRLQTGRSHQIRVQMAHYGHPLIGDKRYGKAHSREDIALYGYRLSFIHPTLKNEMVFEDLPNGGAFSQMTELNPNGGGDEQTIPV